jgi:N-acetylglucosaminyldiphosphoundecaprenol N-acetyl-beta-D-mannosaminyltransferase
MLNKMKILGVDITNDTSEKILEYLLQRLKEDKKFYIVTPNPELMVFANRHEDYRRVLNSAEISLADGAGLFMASVFLGKPLKQRIPGVDFVEFICKNTSENPISMGFLGARAGVAEKVAECLLKKYPWLNISYVGEEWGAGRSPSPPASEARQGWTVVDKSTGKLAFTSTPKSIDILFVAFGSPKQEEWIYKNLDKLPVKAAMGVGGAFDFIAGSVTRAPFMVRAMGFEWLYRLIKEPWRARRQRALFTFVRLVWKARFG